MSKQIALAGERGRGRFAIVDDQDFPRLSKYRWFFQKRIDGSGYAYRNATVNGKRVTPLMHREIMSAPDGSEIDHKNRDKLDNRRQNLRPSTRSGNQSNRSKKRGASSAYKGVTWNKLHRKWGVGLSHNNKWIGLGYFADEIQAARVYDSAAFHFHGEFACLNFPDEPPSPYVEPTRKGPLVTSPLVHWHKGNRRYMARVRHQNEMRYIGSFKDKSDAVIAARSACALLAAEAMKGGK